MDNSSAEPANFQSAFNPPAATEPSKVTGQPSPELPDTPMHIPSRTVTQPGMPNSYTAASQSVANSPFASLANVEPRRPTVPTRQSSPLTGSVLHRHKQPSPHKLFQLHSLSRPNCHSRLPKQLRWPPPTNNRSTNRHNPAQHNSRQIWVACSSLPRWHNSRNHILHHSRPSMLDKRIWPLNQLQ